MKRMLLMISVLTALCAAAQSQTPSALSLVKLNAKPVRLAADFRFLDSPVSDSQGNVYFSNVPANEILIWTIKGQLNTYRKNTNAANGLAFDQDGSLVVCEGLTQRIVRDDLHGNITVLADTYNGKRLNSPNDLWIDPKGGIYFTDPRYGKADDMVQDKMGVYYLPPKGKLERVADDLVKPNGIIGTPDGKMLYIADEKADKVWAYTILKNGRLSKKHLFAEYRVNGMTMDEKHNVYLASHNVMIVAPDGKLLEEIHFPEHPVNLCFGGSDNHTLFVTTYTALYSLDMIVGGAK